jgi:DNA-binding LacI/PurR family transcriptional regulator
MAMERKNKFMGIAEMLSERLERGDYALRRLPSEMELAEETGVSRMTARRALKHLIDAGVFRRDPNRRLEVAEGGRGRVHQIAFLMPPVISEDVQAWQWAAEQAVATIKGVLRPIVYTDWNDVLLSGALKGFDGVFLMQTGVEVPETAISVLKNSPNPVVALDLDLSARGIPSVCLFPEKAVWRLLDHLRSLGHRRVACFHTCEMNRVFRQRIDSWQRWKERHGLAGELFNLPGRARSIDYGAIQAEKECGRLLAAGALRDTAILCSNVWTALGVNRAIQKHGLIVGRDLSTCAINDEMLAPWMNPSLTALRMPDPSTMLRTCARWMAAGGRNWQGPKLLVPRQVLLFQGESAGPPASRKKFPKKI